MTGREQTRDERGEVRTRRWREEEEEEAGKGG